MKEEKDRLMEGLWMLYQAEGSPRNISIEQFCMNNDVNYNEFYKWYKSMHHGVYELQIDGRPGTIKTTTLTAIPSKEYRVNPHAESAHEVYTSDGKHVLMSEEAYELYEHQLDLNSKMHRRIHDMEFKDNMKSLICKAVIYFDHYRKQLFAYRNDSRYTIDNSLAERCIRPLTCERKVSMFYGSHEGADISVVYQTFVESCKLACISVKDYFVKFFESIASGKTDYENLLPTTIGLKQ